METIKKYFSITASKYQFEWNDVRCAIQLANVICIMIFGLSVAWFGLFYAMFGVIKDLTQHRHMNEMFMHLSSVALNVYFLILLYRG